MRRILLRLWIFGLAFGLGISVSALWRLYLLYQPPPASEVIITLVPPRDERPLKIHSAFDARGPKATYHIYNVSDGSQVTTTCETFVSSAAATRALRARLGQAQVAESSVNVNDKGRREGETVLVTTPTVIRLSTHDRRLCVTEVPSLRHLQIFAR